MPTLPDSSAMLGGGGTPVDAVPMGAMAAQAARSHARPGARRKHKLGGKKKAGHRRKGR